jgi:hypothetical protein
MGTQPELDIFHNLYDNCSYSPLSPRAATGRQGSHKPPVTYEYQKNKDARAGVLRHTVSRVRMLDSVMKFAHAWTSSASRAAKRQCLENRPRNYPACRRALSRQTGKGVSRAMRAVFRTGRFQLAFGDPVLGPGVPYLAARQGQRNRCLSSPPPTHETCSETMDWAALAARHAFAPRQKARTNCWPPSTHPDLHHCFSTALAP